MFSLTDDYRMEADSEIGLNTFKTLNNGQESFKTDKNMFFHTLPHRKVAARARKHLW